MSRRIKIQLAVLIAALGFGGTALAEDVIEKSSSGEVNWTKGIIYAKGMAPPKKDYPPLKSDSYRAGRLWSMAKETCLN